MARTKHQYQVAWNWAHAADDAAIHDDVMAADANSAVRKLRANLKEEYVDDDVARIIIREVYLI